MQALDIDDIMKRFDKEKSAFADRMQKAVGRNYIPYQNAVNAGNKMRFYRLLQQPVNDKR
jgi:hypothetical protein